MIIFGPKMIIKRSLRLRLISQPLFEMILDRFAHSPFVARLKKFFASNKESIAPPPPLPSEPHPLLLRPLLSSIVWFS